jgi:hypothetical protein
LPDTERLTDDEHFVVAAYRRVKMRGHGDLEISVFNGKLVKAFEVVKNDLNKFRTALKEVGA